MKILLVDDSATILHAVSKMLKELGYENVQTAEDPQEAIGHIKIIPPDLIISDWNMPKGSGLDLLKFVRTNKDTAKAPFIFLTSDHDKSKVLQAKSFHPQAYILKPMTKKQIAERLVMLSKTHGIQPPAGYENVNIEDAVATGIVEPLYLNKEDIGSILRKVLLIYNGKMDKVMLATELAEKHFHCGVNSLNNSDIARIKVELISAIDSTLNNLLKK